MKHLSKLFWLPAMVFALFASCSDLIPDYPVTPDAGSYTLSTRYSHIRSYPGGGGVFTVFIEPHSDFRGDVALTLQANPLLHATLSRRSLDARHRVTEILLAPEPGISLDSTVIMLQATHRDSSAWLPLRITMYPWSHSEAGPETDLLRVFLDWQQNNHPELVTPSDPSVFRRFITYPEHLVVEHWSFVGAGWDVRLCRHVMIPPHDWSMVLFRPLHTLTPVLAARRDTQGNIVEIPVSEYPVLYGY
ncbi:MAG: hypothetical protein M5R41_06545 [Bacteroidia bacterium]|nr:hypothetical protein [Bacteroidia bacterium]